MAGSNRLNTVFCWLCLLFSDDNGIGHKTGFDNLNALTRVIPRHKNLQMILSGFQIDQHLLKNKAGDLDEE